MVASPVIASRPHLWAADLGAVISLSGRFATGDLFNVSPNLEFGQHIILVDSHTPELIVRKAIYQIISSGNSPEIYEAQQPIAILAAHESLSAGELSAQIVGTSQTWEKWLEKRSQQEDLSVKNAVQIAKVVLAYEQEPQRSVELSTLRNRCGESSYDWNNLIRKLEKEIASKNNLIGSVTGDSAISGDTSNPCGTRFSATVTTVTEILDLGFTDYEEQQLLEDIWEQSGLSKGAFWKLVNSQKNKIDTLQPEDEIKLNSLINWHNAKLDFKKALPSMAVDFEHDAQVLGIEPIVLWQPFLASVMSLVGKKIKLDIESHMIPAIAWTMTVLKSGGGKTRADNLILAPIKKLQSQARSNFLAEMEEFETALRECGKDEEKPTRPIEQKYLFEVATIQAVMRRASEQPGKRGQLWTRDEISGLFKSLGQFGSGENEGKECLLKMWDGSPMQVDRVRQEDSFFIDETRISVNGGIQPGHYRNVFNDPNDSQGLTARFLTANPQPLKPKRVKGYCDLSAKLPFLYEWLINLPEAVIKLSSAADSYYDKLYDEIGGQAHTTSQPAIQAWMYKLPANLLRIALALHFIECYHDQNRDFSQIQKDTLERAVLFAQYYRSAFHIIQETTTDNDDISSILLKIWDASATKHPDGITTRDAYRNIKAIQYRAKDMGRDVSAYTAELFGMLEAKGKGRVVKNGRTIKFIAKIGGTDPDVPDPNIKPDISPGSLQEEVAIIHSKSENPNIGDRVTVPEKTAVHDLEVSPPNLVSPVTVANHSESIGQIEITPRPDAQEDNSKVVSPCSLLEIEKRDGDINDCVDREVEVRSLNGKLKFFGRLASADVSGEGNVAIITLMDGKKPAQIKDVYLVENKPLLDRMLEVWDYDMRRGDVLFLGEMALSASPEQLQLTFAQCSPEQVDCINKAVFELVESSVVWMQDSLPEMDADTLDLSTENWQPEFQQAVKNRLTPDEREALKQIAANPTDWDDDSDSESSPAANSDPAVDQVDISTSTDSNSHDWKVGDRCNHVGNLATVAKVDPSNGSILVVYDNGERANAEIGELFRLE